MWTIPRVPLTEKPVFTRVSFHLPSLFLFHLFLYLVSRPAACIAPFVVLLLHSRSSARAIHDELRCASGGSSTSSWCSPRSFMLSLSLSFSLPSPFSGNSERLRHETPERPENVSRVRARVESLHSLSLSVYPSAGFSRDDNGAKFSTLANFDDSPNGRVLLMRDDLPERLARAADSTDIAVA